MRAALRGQDRRAGRGQGRAGHRATSTRPAPTCATSSAARRSAPPARRWSSKRASTGPECSLHRRSATARRRVPLAPAQDFKRVGDGDQGANTGGMGAYSPMPAVDDGARRRGDGRGRRADARRSSRRGASTTAACSTPGVMLTAEGPKVLEYNVRFGDPETQVVAAPARRASSSTSSRECGDGAARRDARRPRRSARSRWCWPRTGYPQAPRPVRVIHGLGRRRPAGRAARGRDRLPRRHHARRPSGRFVVAGGRVLARHRRRRRPGRGRARARLRGAPRSTFEGMSLRSDIAARRGRKETDVIPRYAPKDMAALFSDETRFDAMLEVELLAAEALAELGVAARGRRGQPAERAARSSTRRSSRRSTSARRSPTTTRPRSSTSSRTRSACPRARGSTTG